MEGKGELDSEAGGEVAGWEEHYLMLLTTSAPSFCKLPGIVTGSLQKLGVTYPAVHQRTFL